MIAQLHDFTGKLLSCKQSILKRPDGSVQYSQRDTKVMVAIYGPADCKESQQLIDKSTIIVNFRPKFGIPGVVEKFCEKIIQNIAETAILTPLHPRTQINITVQVLHDNGSLLACAINAVSMALQDAGVSLQFLPIAISQIVTKNDLEEESIIFSPNKDEEENLISEILFVFDSTNKNIICSNVRGKISTGNYKNCLKLASNASDTILQFYKESIAKKFENI